GGPRRAREGAGGIPRRELPVVSVARPQHGLFRGLLAEALLAGGFPADDDRDRHARTATQPPARRPPPGPCRRATVRPRCPHLLRGASVIRRLSGQGRRTEPRPVRASGAAEFPGVLLCP